MIKKGALEFNYVVIIVLALIVLLVVTIFFLTSNNSLVAILKNLIKTIFGMNPTN